jgi:hypothetical protein
VAVGTAFYTINSSMAFAVVNTPTIPLPTSASLAKGLTGGHTGGRMDYSIGFRPSGSTRFNLNTDVKRADGSIQVRDPIPKYAVFDTNVPTFPSGLEFLIVGPAGSRRILSRVVVMAGYIGHVDSRESIAITSGSS